ncbi:MULTISPECIES: deoxyribose-phosphate aldolase [Carboxydocella]|uniref:Deoxyribose-phosphate aldolase n=2 Tax=Carboxydocella TaxID=178898 RepID=A0A1T4NGG5_9FIRM|nr:MULTISPECIES: deoxyribose-phosphate aldolase [Carboxydocella]AVX20032.1 deoxyribose-phosphate aldolase [Carboxydocella thermautotrophica]AVX30449.1 deoxyribose-phosphate aldolase [Carboxydocella thermautotrophica]SJZ78342.1 deoxyribose-phosphate aldolase [Carboxydocella sporoproducens DSM 16521]GAW30183.1 2-deoxyribose-5-phosphate aldolase [Carboxydocella sp. ULO1]GAW32272.1 2-deoxyribose-5-phosphate aldolase [Carboxydocella sp. JDF658]
MNTREIAAMIDHTLLKPETTPEQIIKLCQEAREHEFASVCVNPAYVALAARELADSPVKVCTVIGFPLGANRPQIKAQETELAIREGAREVDMVINIGAAKAGDWQLVEEDIRAVVAAARNLEKEAGQIIVKVIIETCLLTDEEKVKACQAAVNAGADFVKTSTGFAGGGATVADVELMRKTVGPTIGVKASGGVRNLEQARAMIAAGANRIGTSNGVAIMAGLTVNGGY